jgi:hypothetical protein
MAITKEKWLSAATFGSLSKQIRCRLKFTKSAGMVTFAHPGHN